MYSLFVIVRFSPLSGWSWIPLKRAKNGSITSDPTTYDRSLTMRVPQGRSTAR
jgi:hypothetical protein